MKNPQSPLSPRSPQSKAGYEYLLAYKITVPIYDYTVMFCKRFRRFLSSKRTYDQMVQAARSGTTNIAEGNQQASLEGYIKLICVNKASLEELLKDFLSIARQHRIPIWEKDKAVREIREIREIWEIIRKTPTLPHHPNFPHLPDNSEVALNLMLTLLHQAIYLQQKLKSSLEQKFVREGGFRENLFRARLAYRRVPGGTRQARRRMVLDRRRNSRHP
ncbi:MAG: four helix bundle protein [Candidatus Chisholmbacteria bacterium]|nr:four helix bundle protein [Candidatus Chisholmbacteria bacterium]